VSGATQLDYRRAGHRPDWLHIALWDLALLEGAGEQEQASPQYRRNDGQYQHCDNWFSQHNANSQTKTKRRTHPENRTVSQGSTTFHYGKNLVHQ